MTDGVLVLAATPIGDPADAAPRLGLELAGADVIAAEDTRRTKRLCDALAVTPGGTMLSYHEHNEARRTPELADRIAAGDRVVLVTDAGMPSVSDPGYRLVSACIERGLAVTCVPGPSAVLMSLAVSGLPVDRFCFEGFCSRKAGERARHLAQLADERRTMVFFEAPHRLAETLTAMAQAFGGDRAAAGCRARPPTDEPVRRGGLAALGGRAGVGARGGITIVVAGATPAPVDPADLVPQVLERVAGGERMKHVCAELAAAAGVSKKALYDAAVAARHTG